MEEIDLKELFEVFWSRKVYIILITLVFIMVGFIYSYLFVEPKYKSETTLLLAQPSGNASGTGTLTTSDLTLNQKLVPTYSALIKGEDVLGTVISNLGVDMSVDSLKKSITVSSVKDTELIQISVINKDPNIAKDIANEIVNVFAEKVKIYYDVDNVNVVNEAKVKTNPYNVNHIKDLAIFAFVGIVLSAIYALVANMLDTTVKSKEDVEKRLGLSVLTEIPIYNFNETKQVKKGGRR